MRRCWALGALLSGAVALASAGELRGTVVDATGEPLAAAIVAATARLAQREADGSPRRHVTRSDAQGRFRMPDLPGGEYDATATLVGVGAGRLLGLSVPEQGAAAAVNLLVSAEVLTIQGRLRITRARQGLHVVVARVEGERADIFYTELQADRFQLNLPPGRYFVKAVAPGWESGVASTVLPAPGKSAELTLNDQFGSEPALAVELIAMGDAEQAVHRRSIDAGNRDQTILREMVEIDARNQARLKEIIATKGWPRASLVGSQAANAAWLIAQHDPADLLPANLAAMQAAADDGEMPWADLALSIDRVLVTQGKPQRYGSQGKLDASGAFTIDPIEDKANVDARRASVGLGPLAEYKRALEEMYRPKSAAAPRP